MIVKRKIMIKLDIYGHFYMYVPYLHRKKQTNEIIETESRSVKQTKLSDLSIFR